MRMIKVTRQIIDNATGVAYGKGDYEVEDDVAERLDARGATEDTPEDGDAKRIEMSERGAGAIITNPPGTARPTTGAASASSARSGATAGADTGGAGGGGGGGGKSDALPDDFAYMSKLEDNGVTKLSQLREMDRDALIALDGIGEATADKIIAALEELDTDSNDE